MHFRPLLSVSAAIALTSVGLTPAAHADGFPSVVVYGDSLSDNGNLYALSLGTTPPSPPYDNGRYSNGPLAVEQLATKLGASLTDFAVAGATSGVGNYGDKGTQTSLGYFGLPGMFAELASPGSKALLGSPLVSSSLFVVWGGANDYLAAGSPVVAAKDVDQIVATLEAAGATHILVPGTPDLGLTPDFLGTPLATSATAYSEAFNTLLQSTLPFGATYVDTFNLLRQVAADPSAYGFTNTTTPCLTPTTSGPITSDPASYNVCSNPSQYLFWDGFHPTTTADTILANEFESAATPTPEPSSLLLLSSGIAGLTTLVRRRFRRQ